MGRMENLRVVDEVLSAIAIGYSNAEFIADQVFPVVTSRKEAGKVRQFGKDSFRYYDAKRAIGADSNVIRTNTLPPLPWQLNEYDLAEPIDYREQSEDEDIDLERAATIRLQDLMLLRREKAVADLVQNGSNYTDSNTAAISVKWTSDSSTPIKDINAGKEVVRQNIGRRPNRLVIGAPVFAALSEHPDFIGRLSNTTTAVVTPELIAEILKIEKVIIGEAVYVTDAGTQTDIWGDNAILFYQPGGNTGARSLKSPGFGYTIQKRAWAPIDKYPAPGSGGKVQMVRATSLEAQKFLGSVAGYLLTDTNA